jgi:hypothetical protein
MDLRNHLLYVFPTLGAWWSNVAVRGVCNADHLLVDSSQLLDVARGIFKIEIGSDRGLVLHEAQIPIRDAMVLEPFDRLVEGFLVKVLDEETMRNDPYADGPSGESAQDSRSTRNRGKCSEKIALSHSESVKGIVAARLIKLPFWKTIRHLRGEAVEGLAEPLGGYRAEAAIEVCNDPV